MAKYVCSVCGFTFDEELGLMEAGIKPGTKWEDIPDDFVCPICGAPKAVFEKQEEKNEPKEEVKVVKKEETLIDDLKEYSIDELATIFRNLSKGVEKQYKDEEMNLFNNLASYFEKQIVKSDGDLTKVMESLDNDRKSLFPVARSVSQEKADRGALRAITWGEKVTNMVSSLLERYKKDGSSFLEGNKVFVCEICGFVYVGKTAPDICPVCKVPKEKIHEVI